MDVTTLAGLLREAEEHHGAYEASAPPHHWSDWYAAYVAARAAGRPPDDAVAAAGRHMASGPLVRDVGVHDAPAGGEADPRL
jgi:hypothetical protein